LSRLQLGQTFGSIDQNAIAIEVNMPESTRPRRCHRGKESDALSQSQRICLPIERVDYERILGDRYAFRKYVDEMIQQHPELFPAAIQQGYQLHDLLPPSKKNAGDPPAAHQGQNHGSERGGLQHCSLVCYAIHDSV
jgi:hypothetical protein